MFPRSFKANVSQRMVLWGIIIGFLLLIYAVNEVMNASRLAGFSQDIATLSASFAAAQNPDDAAKLTKKLAGLEGNFSYFLHGATRNKILLSSIFVFALIWIASLEYRWLARPISGLADALGNRQRRDVIVGRYAMRRDEIGALGRALVQNFQHERHAEEASQDELMTLASEVDRQTALRLRGKVFEEEMSGIAHNLERQAISMRDAAVAMSRLSTDVDANAVEAAQSSRRAAGHMDEVTRAVAEIFAALMTASRDIDETAEITEGTKHLLSGAQTDSVVLTEAARAVEGVVSLISDIAAKTNLVALNATIEAAHAGESGRGFAIVASEVKQLALQTAQATVHVRDKLAAITASAHRMAGAVDALGASIGNVNVATQTIRAQLQHQRGATETISATSIETASDVRAVSDKVSKVAGIAVDAREAAEAVTTASAELGNQAAQLRGTVDRFVTDSMENAA
jgi:methyl-accepting chemotaxis protein